MNQVLESRTPLDQAVAIQLAQHFHHNDFGWIVAANLDTPNWKTRKDRDLCIGELVREYLDIERLIGVNFGKTTKYALIDLDYSSQYHPSHDRDRYKEILHALETIGLTRYIVIQSSHSRGLHIYLPLSTAVPTFWLAAAIRVTLIAAGFEIKNGQLEIFPNAKRFASAPGDRSYYNPHRLPLQPDSGSWLMEDDGLSPQPISDSIEAQISEFLNQWQLAAEGQDLDLLNRKLPQLYKTYKKNKYKYRDRNDDWNSVEAEKWRLDLLLTITTGWYDCHQTYHLLPKILAYGVVFLKLEGEALYEWMLETILNAPGYYQYCRHQHEIEKIVRSWIKTNERTQYYVPYCSHPARSQPYPFPKNPAEPAEPVEPKQPHPANVKRSSEAQERILTAYTTVSPEFTSKTSIGQRKEAIRNKIQKQYGIACSETTLNKYKNIWHPEFNNYYTPNQKSAEQPEAISVNGLNDPSENTEIDLKTTQTDDQHGLLHTQIPMICSERRSQPECDPSQLNTDLSPTISTQPHSLEDGLLLGEEKELSTYTQHYNLRPEEVVTQQPKPGKFELLGGALGKIATLAAIVVGIVSAVGIDKEPTVVAEIASDPIAPEVEFCSPIPVAPTQSEAEDLPLRPCDDPRISPMYFVPYNLNQIGVPWNTAAEFHKFLGYLFIVAKIDKTIQNPWAWAVKSIKNIKERGINSHWLTFTGQQMLDPNSPNAELLRQQFSPTPPVPASVTINRPNESISKIVERGLVDPHPTKPEPKPTLSSPPDPTQIATPRAYQPQQHTLGDICLKCSTATPTAELERWQMCRFCAQTILWRRTI
jgi:hypothetical protein